MAQPRSLRHPGAPSAERWRVAACRAHPVELILKAGDSVNEAVTSALREAGFTSGFVRLDGVSVEPMRYVIPASAPDETHVAWYSDTHAPEGRWTIDIAGAIVGIREAAPFLHCHGIWRDPAGLRRAGHLLPHESIVSTDVAVSGWGIEGAGFVARHDSETNFTIFAAQPSSSGAVVAGGKRALACTVKPNADISKAIEDICRSQGFASASVHGVGSLVGVDFADGRHVPSYATEVMIVEGTVDGEGKANLDVALADMDGSTHEGRLLRNANSVCITFELAIVES